MSDTEVEQLDDTVVIDAEADDIVVPPADEIEIEENEIVLADQETEKKSKSDPEDHILKRVMKGRNKLQDENETLKAQIQQLANQSTQVVAPRPDEFAFDNRDDFLAADAKWQQELLSNTVSQQLNVQQDGHRVAAEEQKRNDALKTYANTAAALKVSDFNETQEKAFDVLGDDFAQLLVENLKEDAPKLMYWLGKNPDEAVRYRDGYKTNPGGTTFELGKLAGKLTIKPKRSEAANPETKVEGAGLGGSGTNWQKQLDKVDADADMSNISKAIRARRKIKAEAKVAGYDVSTLK